MGNDLYGIVFDGTNNWVSNNGGINVTKLPASDGANLVSFNSGTAPRGLAFDVSHIGSKTGPTTLSQN